MDETDQIKIIKHIKVNVDNYGETSIKSIASRVTFNDVSLADQKRLAKIVVKEYHFVSELRRGEIYVKTNQLYDPSINWTSHDSLIKGLIATLAGTLIFIIFHIILH